MKITPRADGNLLDFLQAHFPDASKTTLRQMLRHGRVTLDGQIVNRANAPVRAGQTIEVGPVQRDAPRPPGQVLLRDAHVIAIEKPAGSSRFSLDAGADDTIYRRLNAYVQETSRRRERIFLVHRLDRGTSGILLFALSREVQAQLQGHMGDHGEALLGAGRGPSSAGGGHDQELAAREPRPEGLLGPEGPDAKLAITHYRVEQARATCTLA